MKQELIILSRFIEMRCQYQEVQVELKLLYIEVEMKLLF